MILLGTRSLLDIQYVQCPGLAITQPCGNYARTSLANFDEYSSVCVSILITNSVNYSQPKHFSAFERHCTAQAPPSQTCVA